MLALFFSSSSAAAATAEDARAVARLYSAAFDREPEMAGLNFWMDSLEQGQSLLQIAQKFRESPEFNKKYGALDNGEFVRQLYRNILGREGEASGIAFWLGKLDEGNSQALVLRQFSESPENRLKTDDLFAQMRRRGDGMWTYDAVSGQVKSTGTIDGFGSIFVNGVEFETDAADITLDGDPATDDALKLGMVVTVDGVINDDGVTGTANTVMFDDEVQGPVTAIEPGEDNDTLLVTILGLQVIVERTGTVFDDVTFDTLAVNDVVEISGFVDDQGRLRATRVEKQSGDDADRVELKGIVAGLAGTQFTLGAYLVEFSGADLSGVSGGTLADGMGVEVKGVLADGTIIASRIEEEDHVGSGLDDDDEVRVEGAITNFVSSAQFEVKGITVDGSGALLRPADLVLEDGAVVQVEGSWEAGVLVARKIESRRGRVEIETTVLSVNPAEGIITLQLYGSPTLPVLVDARTMLEDDTDQTEVLTLEQIMAGDFLEVEAIQDGGTLVATRIDRDRVDDEILQAPVGDFTAGESITLLGVTYGTSGAEFRSRSGKSITAEEFYSQLAAGDLVKVKDRQAADGVADEVHLERLRALDGDECEADDSSASDDDCDAEEDDDSGDEDDGPGDDSDGPDSGDDSGDDGEDD